MALKVLIAHGNTQRLKQAVSDLHSAGFEVVATPDGGDAFARFFEEAPDVVICSLVLPGLPGDNIARMVRSQSPGTEIVVLVEQEGLLKEQGINVIVEPMTLQKLRDAMPAIAFDAPPSQDDAPDLTAASPTHVFYHAVLKRFQRDNRALQSLDDTGIAKIAGIAENKNFQDGELIIKQGDAGDGCYLLVEGQVRVTLAEQGDKEVARISAGGFFGEMAMLKDTKRSASVWSIGQTTTLWFSKELFTPILAEYTQMREVLSGVALKRTEENLWRMLFDDDEVQKSIAQLGDLPGQQQAGDDDDITVDEEVATEQPAAATASTPSPVATPVVAAASAQPAAEKRHVTRTFAPAAVLLESDAKKPWPAMVKEQAFRFGAAAGFGGGVILTLLLSALFRDAPAPVPNEPTVAKVSAPASQPASMAVAPASLPASAPASAPVAVTEVPAKEPGKDVAAKEEPSSQPAKKVEPVSPDVPRVAPPRSTNPDRDALSEAYKAGNFKEVAALAKKLPKPLDPDGEFMRVEAERHMGVASALDDYLAFAKSYPNHSKADDAQFWAADFYTNQGKTAEARALYEKIAANEKSNFRTSAQKRLEK